MARSVGGREPGRAAQDRGETETETETETESEPRPGQIRGQAFKGRAVASGFLLRSAGCWLLAATGTHE